MLLLFQFSLSKSKNIANCVLCIPLLCQYLSWFFVYIDFCVILTFISKCSWFIVFSFYIQVFRVLQKFYYHLNYLTLPVCNNKNCYWTLCVDSQSSQFSYPIQLTCFWLWKVCGEVITHNYKNLKVKAMILRMSNYAASA